MNPVERLEALRAGESVFDTDPDAKRGTWAGELHQARLDLAARLAPVASQTGAQFFETPVSSLEDMDFARTQWIVENILYENAVGIFGGEPKAGKTILTQEAAVAIATATPLFGKFLVGPLPRAVVMFLAEDDLRGCRNHFRAMAKARGLRLRDLTRIYLECRSGLNLMRFEDLCRVVASVRMLPEIPAVLFFDPVRDLFDGEENDSKIVSAVMQNVRVLRAVLGCAIILVHHVGKPSEANAGRRPGQRLRGSGVWHAASDVILVVDTPKIDNSASGAQLLTTKVRIELKAARSAPDFTLTRRVTDDEHGEMISIAWEIDDEALSDDGIAEKVEAVVRETRLEWVKAPEGPKPLAKKTLRALIGGGTTKIDRAIHDAEASGRIREASNGSKSIGWLYVPADDEKVIDTHQHSSALVPVVSDQHCDTLPLGSVDAGVRRGAKGSAPNRSAKTRAPNLDIQDAEWTDL